MKALVVYSHPRPESFTFEVKETVVRHLQSARAQTRVIDLYGEEFDPRLSALELENYTDTTRNRNGIEAHCAALAWCDTLIFVYPTWWSGLPAMLKGWLDRVLVPGLAFDLPDAAGGDIKPALTQIKRLAVFTTCGASWWMNCLVGAPGRRTILRGLRPLCAKRCKTSFTAHYLMDRSTISSRSAHLGRVERKMDKLLK